MISFNLTALTQEAPSIQRKEKTRNTFSRKTFQDFTLNSFIVSTFIPLSRFNFRIPSRNTALQYFKKKSMAENPQFTIDEDHEKETEPIYLSSDEIEIDSLCSSPIPQLPNNLPDKYSAITQLIAAQHEQMSLSGTSAPQYPTTTPTSVISDDENDDMLTPKIGNPAQFLPYTPNRNPIPLQIRHKTTPIPDTPEPLTPDNRGHSDIFRPYDIPQQPSSIPLNNPPPNITTVSDELRNKTLHPNPQRKEWVTGCLVCGKSYDQVIDETAANYLNQTAQSGERVRERQIKRNAFIDGIQSGVSTFLLPGVSQAATCDGMVYSVNIGGQNSGTQGYALPLFEEQN